MKSIQVFDPALCCSTGVCGVEVDQALVSFSADADWAQGQGAKVERYNLAQQPMAFAENAAVKGALERSGESALPLILVDGKVAMSGRYPARDELAQWLGLVDGAAAISAGVKVAPSAKAASAGLAAIAVSVAPASACCSPAPATAVTGDTGTSKCC